MTLKQKVINGVLCSITAVLAIVFNTDHELSVSENGLRHIANEEGCRLKAYQCSANRWTVGLGHTSTAKPNASISHEKAAQLFISDVAKAESVVKRLIIKRPTQGEYDMMVSFVFNLGQGKFAKSTLLKLFNKGENRAACEEYLRWVFVNGKDCRIASNHCGGIPKRRETERNVCLNGW